MCGPTRQNQAISVNNQQRISVIQYHIDILIIIYISRYMISATRHRASHVSKHRELRSKHGLTEQ